MHVRFACVFGLSVLLATSALFAQNVPDIVRSRDGGFVRGSIIERVPSSHVLIQLPTGERRRIELSTVTYAGPAAEEGARGPGVLPSIAVSSPAAARSSPRDENAHLQVLADEPGRLSLHYVSGTRTMITTSRYGAQVHQWDTFTRVCDAPCTTTLPTGAYILGVADGHGEPTRAITPPFELAGSMSLSLGYTSRAGFRIAGLTVLLSSLAASIALVVAGITIHPSRGPDGWLILGGFSTLGVALAVSLPMVLQRDEARVRVVEPDGARGDSR